MEFYYLINKILHIVGMASWFGVALAISIILSKNDYKDLDLILDLSTKVEMPASFFIPLTGVLMMIENTNLLQDGWLYLKIAVGLIAIVFTHISRAFLIHKDLKNIYTLQKFTFYRNICLVTLTFVIIIVGYK
ncbi:MAG: hypothetical protein VX924_05080 [Candidatus Neomarinimicrobiota bacterium]|nr:hypothetical protein [Candidatus Neomarinimicrobiota bacterium]MEC7854714.1 hypothetical protein [Candidatus Neomarinimicrobiota bacterium]MEC7980885.1 hypothetical protein [Candidatus Neomarinimicrobiota bacterium]|tara:strand:+ start:15944 stop:16342 length:399 start_codon:yes stop_codon:yes gene_type:complete